LPHPPRNNSSVYWAVTQIFLTFLALISVYGVIRPVRGSLLIGSHGSQVLPLLWIVSGVLILAFVLLYSYWVGHYSPRRVFLVSVFLAGSSLLGIAWGVARNFSSASYALYLWTDVTSLILAEQLWAYTDEVFHSYPTDLAKRYLGLVGAGGILGAVLGNAITSKLSGIFDYTQLIEVAAGCMLLCLIFGFTLPRLPGKSEALSDTQDSHGPLALLRGCKIVAKSRYLICLFLLVHLSQILSNLMDFQFNSYVQMRFTDAVERTRYLSDFLFSMNTVSLALMLLLAPLIMRFLGLRSGLLLLPVSNLATNFYSTVHGAAKSLDVVKLVDKSLNYSIQRATKELLFVPTSKEIKFRAKPVIDMFAYRFSEISAAALLIPLLRIFDWKQLSGVIIILLVLQVYLVLKLVSEYKKAVKSAKSVLE
jgi:AAA family ATP:ADP antiporter